MENIIFTNNMELQNWIKNFTLFTSSFECDTSIRAFGGARRPIYLDWFDRNYQIKADGGFASVNLVGDIIRLSNYYGRISLTAPKGWTPYLEIKVKKNNLPNTFYLIIIKPV